jgi:16S rRNA (guanine527-N7)-methyltransferase
VAPAIPSQPAALIERAGAAFGLSLDAPVVARLTSFFETLLRWNARINLTGARSMNELVEEHLPDSFALSDLVPPAATLVDVGSGGGLPALPLAILRPDLRLTLVEPRAKRVAFLRAAVRELGLEVEVVPDRMEALDRRFDVANARATFAPEEWLTRAGSIVAPGGLVVLLLSGRGEVPAGVQAERVLPYRAGSKERVAVTIRL